MARGDTHSEAYGSLTPEEHDLAQRFLDGDDEALADLFEMATGVRPYVTDGGIDG